MAKPFWQNTDINVDNVEGVLNRICEEAGFYIFGSHGDWIGAFTGVKVAIKFAVRNDDELDPIFNIGFAEEHLLDTKAVQEYILSDDDMKALFDVDGLNVDFDIQSKMKKINIGGMTTRNRRHVWTVTLTVEW